MRYAERGWTNNGSQEEGQEESNQEESNQKEVVFSWSPWSGTAGGVKPPAYFLRTITAHIHWITASSLSDQGFDERG